MSENWKIVSKIAALIALLFFIFTAPPSICAYYYANDVLSGFNGAKAAVASYEQTSFIYGENGAPVKELHGEINRVPVLLAGVPKHVQQAFVAIEDERFYRHHGVDIKAIIRATYSYLETRRVTEGASTITQQTMKLYFLSPEQTLKRKVKEAVLAFEFERRYSKEKILELYLNRIYFGEGAYGIQTAANTYFDKDAKDLTVAEGALLAALVQAPSEYDPYINPDVSLQRRDVVIEKMVQQGFITGKQGMEAYKAPLKLAARREADSNHSFFIDYVIDEAIAAVGEEKLLTGGLKIYSTLEPEIQKKAEMVLERPYLFPSDKAQAALAIVENGTGAIKALVGGREYVAKRGFNRATQLSRQPGSAFKPIAVYAPAFELGYSPNSMIFDTPFRVGAYEPRNSDGGFYGQISVRTALQWSRNVAAVRLLNEIGVDKGYEMASRLGFNLSDEDRCLPLGLGGLTKGVSPLQMSGAYSAFANQGVYIKPYSIKYIENPGGQVIYKRQEGVTVMKASTAEAMKDVLSAAVRAGTGYRAGLRGVEVAGKTGTTELPDTPVFSGLSGNKDAWFVGLTPRYTAAVWMGYDEKDMDRSHYLTSYGGNQPAEIFRLVMAGILSVDDSPLAGSAAPRTQESEKKQDKPGEKDAKKQEPGTDKAGGQKVEKQEPGKDTKQPDKDKDKDKDKPERLDSKEPKSEDAGKQQDGQKKPDTPPKEDKPPQVGEKG